MEGLVVGTTTLVAPPHLPNWRQWVHDSSNLAAEFLLDSFDCLKPCAYIETGAGTTRMPSAAAVAIMTAEVTNVGWSDAMQNLPPGNKVLEVLLFWVIGLLVKGT